MELSNLFDFASNKYRQLTYQTEVLICEQMPRLSEHLFNNLQINLEIYTVRWFLSLFCIDLPIEYSAALFDLYLHEKTQVLVRVALTLLARYQNDIMRTTDQEEVHRIMTSIHEDASLTRETLPQFFKEAMSLDIPSQV